MTKRLSVSFSQILLMWFYLNVLLWNMHACLKKSMCNEYFFFYSTTQFSFPYNFFSILLKTLLPSFWIIFTKSCSRHARINLREMQETKVLHSYSSCVQLCSGRDMLYCVVQFWNLLVPWFNKLTSSQLNVTVYPIYSISKLHMYI